MQRGRGFSLIELMVSVLILSVLASVALPYAEKQVTRQKEAELRDNLRTLRKAIDRFHEDWQRGRIPPGGGLASEDGFPRSLRVLVEGVSTGTMDGGKIYYLRRIPRNPFADQALSRREQWRYRSYQDAPDSEHWGGEDVYDVMPTTTEVALDGSCYCDW